MPGRRKVHGRAPWRATQWKGQPEPFMSCTLSLEAECVGLRLPAGTELVCRGGTVWVTIEAPGRASPDLLLARGERHRLQGDAEVFLAALHGAGPALCRIEAPRQRRGPGFKWLRGLASWPFARLPGRSMPPRA
ncbi:DUF2917 domain-containing protein [Cupriavidus alkaliphilus]|uniref:DUF2917 domain-containing protein n=1 Tax=Cupriavidus alkaliphilus TaxID=942866 RepID=UPI00311AAEA6